MRRMDERAKSAGEVNPTLDDRVTRAISDQRLANGDRLGRYRLLEPLGAGGMGVVYRARDERLERDVAIKILAAGVLSDEELRRRFLKEALALAKLSHSHIAAVFDAGQQDGVDFIVMECVQGESLAARLKSGPLAVKEATSIVLQIAQALDEAHERGVVHRDLKPANVMITPKGQVKVLDFGLAKLLADEMTGQTVSLLETQGILGTPLYMSPEQAMGKDVDARTDLWSLGVLYYELLTGRVPFKAANTVAVLRAIADDEPARVLEVRPDLPPAADAIVRRALEKDPTRRYQTAAEFERDASELLQRLTSSMLAPEERPQPTYRLAVVATTITLLLCVIAGYWFYSAYEQRRWAHEQAIPQINALIAQKKTLAAFLLIEKARRILPGDPQLVQLDDQNSIVATITSSPSAATVAIKDYVTPDAPWHTLGVTPLKNLRIPNGYFRWKVSSGAGEMIAAPGTDTDIDFDLDNAQRAPEGMVYVPAATWSSYIDFVGWIGPYKLPPYDIDRYEVTNEQYQQFVSSGGYSTQKYWTEPFIKDGRKLTWEEAMREFRDTSGRPGPSTWVAGHYPEGQGNYPVAGVSWFEAAAYAAFAGKSLPVFAQWFQAASPDLASDTIMASNIAGKGLAPVGAYPGLGVFGTYDMAGNISEWAANPVGKDARAILGGSWKSQPYLYQDPQAISPFDRSELNGFRCVRNLGPLPAAAEAAIQHAQRDFSHFQPVSDGVFEAYKSLYAYPNIPLNAKLEGTVKETADWREEKVTFDTAYRGERMAAYLFLPKNVQPPFQTVLFFPSARIMYIPDNHGGQELGDLKFVDYVIQSGRAVMYPIYQDTYERRVKFDMPGGAQNIELTTDWYKDAARSLDYLATRADIDSSRLAYLGVSMGSAEGVIAATLLQDRLKTVILLDGGYFLEPPPPGGDQANFAPRMKKPVLMVNGRYDFTFSLDKAQNPLFAMLGTPASDKRHVVLDTAHDVTEQRTALVKTVLDWLDHYLGPVKE